jgi:hypothetical protein
MKKAGILLIALGIFSVFLAFNMDVVIGTSYNIGLLNERQNIVYLSGVLFLAGIMLFGFGVVAKEESKNLKTFALWTFLTPVIFLVAIKVVINIQEEQARQAIKAEQAERARQEEQARQEAIKAEQAERARQVEEERRAEKKRQDEFVDNKNGTVTDKSTGLTWQKCSVGQTWTGDAFSGEATNMSWNDAMKLSNSFAGYNDWRLPTNEELMTLVFCSDGKHNTDYSCKNQTVTRPTINTTYFPYTEDLYWSSSPDADDSSQAWGVYFGAGLSDGYYKSFTLFVRLVR